MRYRSVLLALIAAGCTSTTVVNSTTTPPSVPSTTAVASDITAPDVTSTIPVSTSTSLDPATLTIESFAVPAGSRPHDVAPAADGGVWYTGQNRGVLGWLDPVTGEVEEIPLGPGARPHGVIVDEDGTPWVTDGGLNAIVSVDPNSREVTVYPLPDHAPDANLNTAVFDAAGTLWFTGQAGFYGALDTSNGAITVFESPGGRGPYGITHTTQGETVFVSLAGSYMASIIEGGDLVIYEPPTPQQGARRVWADSRGNVWVSEWNSGNVSRYVFDTEEWTTWKLPGDDPAAYAVYVDENDIVWLSDFASNSIVRFDPQSERFTSYALPHLPGDVRQIHGRPGEVWGAESAADHLVLIRTR